MVRKLWRWAGEVDERNAERRNARGAAADEAARSAGFENATAQKTAENAEKVAKAEQHKAEAQAKKAEAAAKEDIKEAKKLGVDIRFLPEYRMLSQSRIGKNDALKLFKALGTPDGTFGDAVIVRRYMSMPGMRAEELMQIEAQVLHKYGYLPTSQSFAAVNALTSNAGMGYLSVTWVKQVAPVAAQSDADSGDVRAPASSSTPVKSVMKTCPRCAEDVKRAAMVCRYCGHEFTERVGET